MFSTISTKFVLGLEVGAKNYKQHVQGVVSILMPKSQVYINVLRKMIRNCLPLGGKSHKIQIKPLQPGQTFLSMIGYCTKDQGRPHYQFRSFNVSPQVTSWSKFMQL